MPTYILEPHDPMIVRDGRPFGGTLGGRSISLPFPFPSTTTGAARTRAGSDVHGVFDQKHVDEVKQTAVAGPLLVELEEGSRVKHWMCPAPDDALFFEVDAPRGEHAFRRRLVPHHLPAGSLTNSPEGLALVGPSRPDPRKPAAGPRFWYWQQFETWLNEPADGAVCLTELGHDGPTLEQRTHVRIRPDTLAAEEGALFETRGLEFTGPRGRRLGLALVTDADLHLGLARAAGERRLAAWRRSDDAPPVCPARLRDAIAAGGACRVILLTPAHMEAGFRPAWLLEPRAGVCPGFVAVATRRPETVSGWDLEKARPKPSRRLLPAGAVLFLSLSGDRAAIADWVEMLWMQCVSDSEQSRRDGFGLAVVGTWSGTPDEMEEVR